MKRLIVTSILASMALAHNVTAASLTYEYTNGYKYTWTNYSNDASDTNYISQFLGTVSADTGGVDYRLEKTGTGNGILDIVGVYRSTLLDDFLVLPAILTDSDVGAQTNVVFDTAGNSALNGGAWTESAFSAVESQTPHQNIKAIDQQNEWLNIHFNWNMSSTLLSAGYGAQDILDLFMADAMFSSNNHFLQVHVKGTGTDGEASEKWRLTWKDNGKLPPTSIPEPSALALLAIGLFGMGASRKFKKA
ncbi:MAG: PEP-CTERM sorting domain-containing protein [Gammaproteobacteria bacterium]